LLQAADGLSTRAALAVPGALELNPLVRSVGLWPAKLLVLALVLLLALRTKKPQRVWTLCGLYAVIVGSNLLLLARHSQQRHL
jgi:Domain of unknown function (DUF5658)